MGFELNRTATNSIKLDHDKKMGKNPMKYEEWSKSDKLERTLTLIFAAVGLRQNRKERKVRGRAEAAESSCE